jgi:hypothetical protein
LRQQISKKGVKKTKHKAKLGFDFSLPDNTYCFWKLTHEHNNKIGWSWNGTD